MNQLTTIKLQQSFPVNITTTKEGGSTKTANLNHILDVSPMKNTSI